MTDEELKRCPFCGGKAEMQTLSGRDAAYKVHCTECDCEADTWRTQESDATEFWNTRALTQPSGQVRDEQPEGVTNGAVDIARAEFEKWIAHMDPKAGPKSLAEWNIATALRDRVLEALSAQLPARPVVTPDDDIHELYLDALAEAEKAMRKYPQPNYVISKVAEEAGEVVKAAIHCAENRETHTALAGEIKQAIAMLLRLYIEGDQVHGLTAPRAILSALEGEKP